MTANFYSQCVVVRAILAHLYKLSEVSIHGWLFISFVDLTVIHFVCVIISRFVHDIRSVYRDSVAANFYSLGTRENKAKNDTGKSVVEVMKDKLLWVCRGCKDPVAEPPAEPVRPINDTISSTESSTEVRHHSI